MGGGDGGVENDGDENLYREMMAEGGGSKNAFLGRPLRALICIVQHPLDFSSSEGFIAFKFLEV